MSNPCCGLISLHKGALLMALLSVIRALGCLAFTSGFLATYVCCKESVFKFLETYNLHIEFVHLSRNVVIGLTGLMIFVFILELPVYSSLGVVAFQKNQRRCSQWWKLKCLLLGTCIVVGIVAMVYSEDRVFIGVIGVIVIIYDYYLIWVVKAYSQEDYNSDPQLQLSANNKLPQVS